jgi:hypothetical protein
MGTAPVIVGLGNCQLSAVARYAGSLLGAEAEYLHPSDARGEATVLRQAMARAQIVFASRGSLLNRAAAIAREGELSSVQVIGFPRIFFAGFHPDLVYPPSLSAERRNPLGNANSAILLAAWRDGLSVDEAVSLFRDEVYAELGYFDAFGEARDNLIEECEAIGLDVAPMIHRWMTSGAFVHQPLHPRIDVLQDIVDALLTSRGLLKPMETRPAMEDELALNAIWPVYPEIAQRLGLAGNYIFQPKNMKQADRPELRPMDLPAFVSRSFAVYSESPPELEAFVRLDDPRFEGIRRFVRSSAPQGAASANPYANFEDFHWWSKAVAGPAPEDVDPVVRPKFVLGREDQVATAGSCFAQHIARHLQKEGFSYMVTEQAPPGVAEPRDEDYGVFTARFGNVYTVRQLLQLVHRAYGEFSPEIDVWALPDGKYVDPFRPRIGRKPFESVEALQSAREEHFRAVREMFDTLDVFVFTMGLTEGWCAIGDGAVVPLAPGVLDARVPEAAYEPKNYSVAEIEADFDELLAFLNKINPRMRVILTVSPVPLIATFEDEHVLTATTYSKAVLRVAAGELANRHPHVAYFPSFEIITGAFNRGRYFAEDLREVTMEGVGHVMKTFMRHYAGSAPARTSAQVAEAELQAGMDLVCDEEEISSQVAAAGR